MRKIFILILAFLMFSVDSYADDWELNSLDLRKAVPNNTSPPEILYPSTNLNPLNKNEGVIRRVNLFKTENVAALTFDMCELETITTGCDMKIIKFLRDKKIPATLFMGGKWIRTHSKRVKQIMLDNVTNGNLFEIANHNWSHGNCALLSETNLKNQILWTQSQYEILRNELLNENPDLDLNMIPKVPELFRLPYGRNSEKSLKIISDLGLRIIQWDVAAESGDNSKIQRAKRSILLFHANLVPKGSDILLREVVRELENKNYRFVTVSELLKLGIPETTRNGYFSKPGDNIALDKKFGIDGTGRKRKK